jgi:hypothetical protein
LRKTPKSEEEPFNLAVDRRGLYQTRGRSIGKRA